MTSANLNDTFPHVSVNERGFGFSPENYSVGIRGTDTDENPSKRIARKSPHFSVYLLWRAGKAANELRHAGSSGVGVESGICRIRNGWEEVAILEFSVFAVIS